MDIDSPPAQPATDFHHDAPSQDDDVISMSGLAVPAVFNAVTAPHRVCTLSLSSSGPWEA